MNKPSIAIVYNDIAPIIKEAAIGSPTKDPWLRVFTGAAIAKCLEFNIASFDDAYHDFAFFQTSGLRGICEDYIALKYFSEKVEAQDTQTVLSAWAKKQMAEGIGKQSVFFADSRPQQPVISNSVGFQTMLRSSNDVLKKYRVKYGWRQNSPRIIDMADACSLRPLYDYLYSSTSRAVHFSPHFFMRMGWGDIEKPEPSFSFSTKNFAGYYANFNQFYGTYLFIKLCKTFGGDLGITEKVMRSLSTLVEQLEDSPRWPELVTFEEMNLSSPNYGKIHALMNLLKEFTAEDRRELVQVVLLERSRERTSKMSAEEKRTTVNQLLSSRSLEEIANIPESKLDAMLHELSKQFIEGVKSSLKAEDVTKFLASIPDEDLIKYIDAIPIDETPADMSNSRT